MRVRRISEFLHCEMKSLTIMLEIIAFLCTNANIFFSASLVPNEEGLFTGKIVIKSKNSQFKVQIPYRAFLLKGQLEVAPNVTHFYLTSKDPPLRRPLVS